MKVHEYREMMRYLTRKPVSSTETPAASGEGLQGFASGGRVLTKKQREVAQIVYGLKDSEVDAWEKNPDNRIKVYRIIKGDTTKETKATGIKPNDPNRIIVKAPRGTEKVSDVIFPNKQIEKSFIKDVKKKFSSPVSASEITFASLAENYPISEKQAGRAVRFLKNKLNLEYPAGTPTKEYYSPEAIKERYGDVTSRKIEEKISKTKTPILKELDLRKKIDLAHRVSKRHMNRLGIQFNTDLVGMDSRLINQIIVKPSESTLKNLYNKQYTLFNNAKKSGITEDISKKLEDINSKIINEVNKTSGRLVGVIVDPKTLETSFHGVNKKLSLDSKTIDLKNLEKLPLEKQAEYLSRVVPKAVNAEVSRGFVPNDFSEILKDPKRQESMIKYTQRVAPELTKDLKEIFKNPTSTKPLKLYADQTGIGQFLETEVGQRLSKSAPNFLKGITKVSTMTGAPVNALIGIVANSEDFKEQGLSDLETLAAGAYKGGTQDFLNFADLIVRKLPVATYEKFVENKPFFENILNKPEYFEFADKQIDKYTESKSLQDRLENRAEYEVRKSFPINVSDTDVPVTVSAEENKNLIEAKKAEILNQNPEFKQAYEQELATPKPEPVKTEATSNLIFGPITFPRYSEQELNLAYGGRAKFANGTEEDDLYIPPLDKPSGTDIPKEGLSGLYFGFRDEPKRVPVDPETGRPIESGGAKELKQILSSLLPEKKPEIGFANERFNISASKSINPYDEDRSTKYQASYKPSKDSGEFLIEKTPDYTAGGYGYNKDGLTYGISGLVDKMGNKNISARIKYDFATGGRVNFSAGGGAIKLARMITDVLGDLRQKLFMPAHTQRTTGAKEAKELATRPYTHPTNQSPQSNILEGIEKSKSVLPKEYHSILDDIKKDVENFDYASASNRADALNKEIPDALNFEKLPKDIFPMLDPLNDAIIIFDPKREKMMGRYTQRISMDPETGRGIRQTFDTWDSQNQRFYPDFEEKLIGAESLEKGKGGLN